MLISLSFDKGQKLNSCESYGTLACLQLKTTGYTGAPWVPSVAVCANN